jgi:hypothetical protein
MEPVDYGGAFLDGVGVAAGMVWAVFAQNPWLLVLLLLIIAGSLYLQLSPRRRRRRSR